ncbi:MAG: hypothetical protein QNJ54_05105 [Prochloraceae cyanobacterium]|nr:hypothetical protein [Prochloraceae cyanobacterium]
MKVNTNKTEQRFSTKESLNPWNYKPWWCQPWSIILVGIILPTGTWILTKIVWVTVVLSLAILAWWTYFLILWPRLIKNSTSLADYYSQAKDRGGNDY